MMDTSHSSTEVGIGHYIRSLWRYAPRKVITSLGLLALVTLTEGVGLLMLVPLLQIIGPSGEQAGPAPSANLLAQLYTRLQLSLSLTTLLATFILLVSLRALLVRTRQVHLADLQLGFVDTLRKRIYGAISHANWLFLSRRRNTDFSHVLTSDILRIGHGTHCFLQILITIMAIVAHSLVAFHLSPATAAMAMVTGAFLLAVLWPLAHRAKRLGALLTHASRDLYASVGDFLQGIKLAKSYAAEERHTAAFDQTVDDTRMHMLGFTRAQANSQLVFQIGAVLVLSALLLVATRFIQLPGPELLVLVLVFARLLPMLSSLQRDWQHVAFMLPAYKSAMAMLAECRAEDEIPASVVAHPMDSHLNLRREIQLRKVRFRYGENPAGEVLAGIDLVIPARQTTALTGPSGSGKSTLADLLMGLLTPTDGEIQIDGQPLDAQRLRTWRRSIAYVPQETFLFHDTLRANLLWAKPDASDADCRRVLELAAATEFVAKLGEGLYTVVGERGIRLSGGERQRIALARALLRRPSLLLLDEATSALDRDNEARILQALDRLHGSLTIIIITHRRSTLDHVDRVVLLQQGKIQPDSVIHQPSSNQRMNRPMIKPCDNNIL